MTIVVAAGNENVNAKTKSSASASDVLTIATSDINDARASFSNFGSRVDLFGPDVLMLIFSVHTPLATSATTI